MWSQCYSYYISCVLLTVFAWEAYEKGAEVHLQADPTKLDLLAKEYKRKKEVFKDTKKNNILDKYGGEEHLEKPPEQLIMGQSVSADVNTDCSICQKWNATDRFHVSNVTYW